MAKRRYTAEEVVTVLRQEEVALANGKRTPESCQEAGITQQTYYRWRKEYGGLKLEKGKRFKELENENTRLKRLIAEPSLEKQILQDVARGKLVSPARRRLAVAGVRRDNAVSERHACRLLFHWRGTQRYQPTVRNDAG